MKKSVAYKKNMYIKTKLTVTSTVFLIAGNFSSIPANVYLFKVNNRNTRKCVKYVQSK